VPPNGNGASHASHASPAARELSAARASEGKLIRFPAATRREDELSADPAPEPVREADPARREPALVRRAERDALETPAESEEASKPTESKHGTQTLIGGAAPVAPTPAAPSAEGESGTAAIASLAEPLPVQWPSVEAEQEALETLPRSVEAEDLHDQFFSAGEEGAYDGGPASLIPESTELEHESLDTIPARRPRTPAQERRRSNMILFVAGVIGFALAVSVFAIWRNQRTGEIEAPVTTEIPAPEERTPPAGPGEPTIPAPPAAEAPASEPDLPTMAMPEAAPPAPGPAPAGASTPASGPASGPRPAGAAGPPPPAEASPPPPRANNPVTGRPPTASFPLE
jgi:hypothetical protein